MTLEMLPPDAVISRKDVDRITIFVPTLLVKKGDMSVSQKKYTEYVFEGDEHSARLRPAREYFVTQLQISPRATFSCRSENDKCAHIAYSMACLLMEQKL